MQEVIECTKCKKKLVSAWPFMDPGTLLQLSGFQDPDSTRVPNYPGQILAQGINIAIHDTYVRLSVFCPDCLHGGGAEVRIDRPKPRGPKGLRAKIRRLYATWLCRQGLLRDLIA